MARTAMLPLAIQVNPSVPANSIKDRLTLAKKNPVHIPNCVSAPVCTDLLAGQMQMMAESIPQAAQCVKQGKLRALAVTSRERSNALADMAQGNAPAFLSPYDFTRYLGAEMPKWAKAVKDLVARLD